MRQTIDFQKKQRVLVACIELFHKRNKCRQWYDKLVQDIKHYRCDEGATSHMIDFYELKNEVMMNESNIGKIYMSVKDEMDTFHRYPKLDIKNDAFYTSLVSESIITRGELDWLAKTYDGVVYRFRANARLMEYFIDKTSTKYNKNFLTEDERASILMNIEPYDVPLKKIEDEYTNPLLMKTSTQDVQNTDDAGVAKKEKIRKLVKANKYEWNISEEHKEEIGRVMSDETMPHKTDRFRKAVDLMVGWQTPIPHFKTFNMFFPDSICKSDYGKVLGQKGLSNLK